MQLGALENEVYTFHSALLYLILLWMIRLKIMTFYNQMGVVSA